MQDHEARQEFQDGCNYIALIHMTADFGSMEAIMGRTWPVEAALSLGLSVCFCHAACCLSFSTALALPPMATHACKPRNCP